MNNKLHKKILILAFVAFIITTPIITFILIPNRPDFSENENRFKATYVSPDFVGYFRHFFSATNNRPNNIRNRQFMERFDEWFADRFMMREDFIILQNRLERLRGKTKINGVYTVGDQMLLSWSDYPETSANLPYTLNAVNNFAWHMSENYGANSYIMLIPTAVEIKRNLLPPNAQVVDQIAFNNRIFDALEHLTSIDVSTILSQNTDSYIFYRTDHHWTSFGSYLGYVAAGERMGFTPFTLGQFDVEHASSDFRGTLFSKTLDFSITPDVISFFTLNENVLPNSGKPELTIHTGSETFKRDTFFFREHLQKKDQYRAFMGGNFPIVEIKTDLNLADRENERSLLVFKDSFAHSMLPFLANHYSRITVLDMRFINADIRNWIELSNYDEVLFLYSTTKFVECNDLMRIIID
ncbi:MAG: DHHW family protein [Oscillospiraceae bacterium]|nr:DHHW family protein [Oscillospiraceae bacterium]